MQLQYIYRADINRDINGVIKVAQNDERSIEQELREYIITRELRRHFNTFLNNYERSLTFPTDKIGVWISGFFGSGKSHFLKILSYLLSNDTVAGKKAVDYFADKFDDPMMFAQLERCAGVPTDTILFNIDSKSPINKDKTAILRVFAKVFYEYRGFYGDDLKVAKLEQFIEKSGKMDAFKAKFEEIHGDIDAVGDKAATEDQVFEACEQAIREIKNLVRMITNDMNGTHILITADHGFLYSYMPLEESDKAEKSFVSGHIVELDRRYVIADGDCAADHMLRIPMTRYQSEHTLFAPLENIRMKKQGGGMNFVHGGISLQEMVVPVIDFQNMRASSKKFMDVKKAELQLISQSRKVSNSIFSLDFYQKDAVSGKVAAATYEIYMADTSGAAVSDKKTVIADKTSNNGSDRVFRTRFTLKSMEFKKTETYYLTIVEKESGTIADRIEFTIDIAFVNDFDF